LIEIFKDEKLVEKIKCRLPYLFQLAELENSRAGKTGMVETFNWDREGTMWLNRGTSKITTTETAKLFENWLKNPEYWNT
jgi:hypothetical protein